jgi:hypothetical protein
MITHLKENYSSTIDLSLIAEGRSIPLSKIGPHYITLAASTELSPGDAVIEMCVDGETRQWKVRIDGAVPFDNRVRVSDIE